MKGYFFIITIISSLGVFNISCKKEQDKWKLPSKVSFAVDINKNDSSSDRLQFNEGTINITEFSIDGTRVQGENPYFETTFPEGLLVEFDSLNKVDGLNFDIPQGTYTRINVKFKAESNEENTIIILGSYKRESEEIIPVRFETNSTQIYNVTAKSNNANPDIILSEEYSTNATILLDPVYWFENVSEYALENADLIDIDGIMTILINETSNSSIENKIKNRIDKSTQIIFD